MRDIEKYIRQDIAKRVEAYDSINDYKIAIGVFEANTNRSKKNAEEHGVTNAMLLQIHELGSPIRNIPARPVLHLTLEYARTTLLPPLMEDLVSKCTDGIYSKADVKRELQRLCMQMERYARDLIMNKDPRLAPNAPSTIARKGENYPLHDTSKLVHSIRCQLIEK